MPTTKLKVGDPVAFLLPERNARAGQIELGRVMRANEDGTLSIAAVFNSFPEKQDLDGVMRWMVPADECWLVEKPVGSPGQDDKTPDGYTVTLTAIGPEKINVIRVVREVCGVGLREAKDIVESAPCELLRNLPESTADEVVERLVGNGATASKTKT